MSFIYANILGVYYRIGNMGQDPQEYLVVTSFFIDYAKNQIVIVDAMKRIFLYYDFDGKYVSKTNVLENEVKALSTAYLLDNNHILLNYCINPWDNNAYNLFQLDNVKSIEKKHITR